LDQTGQDTARVSTLLQLARFSRWPHPELTTEYCVAARILSEDLDYTQGKAEAYGWLGYLVNNNGQKDSSIILYRASLRAYSELKDEAGIANSISNIGFVYSTTAYVDSTLKYYHEALRIREDLDDPYGLANSLNNLGYMYNKLGDSEQALRFHLRALAIREAIDDKEGQTASLSNLGYIYKEMGDYSDALNAYQRQQSINIEIGNKKALAESIQNLAFIAGSMGNWTDAVDGHRKSLAIRKELDYPRDISEGEYYLGEALCMVGKHAEGWRHMEKSLARRLALGDERGIANSLRTMSAQALVRGWYKKSIRYGEDAVKHFQNLGFPKDTQRALNTLGNAYATTGFWEQAYGVRKAAQHLSDSILDLANVGRMTRLRVTDTQQRIQIKDSVAQAIETTQKSYEQRTSQLKAIKEKNTTRLIAGGALLLVICACTAYLIDRRRRKDQHVRKTAVLQTQAFRAQVNPHFIHSALESINEFVQANESDLASSFLTRFARLMRAVLENARLDEVSLQRDLDVLRDYLELERTRTQNRFSYTIIVDPNIDQEEVLVPPMLLQPFAEEAIWKDLAQQVNGSISITVSKVDDALLMTVQDNGEQTGSGTTVMTETGSDHGVSITKARLELYQQTERRPATLRWTPLTVGHKVEVLLPWRIAA